MHRECGTGADGGIRSGIFEWPHAHTDAFTPYKQTRTTRSPTHKHTRKHEHRDRLPPLTPPLTLTTTIHSHHHHTLTPPHTHTAIHSHHHTLTPPYTPPPHTHTTTTHSHHHHTPTHKHTHALCRINRESTYDPALSVEQIRGKVITAARVPHSTPLASPRSLTHSLTHSPTHFNPFPLTKHVTPVHRSLHSLHLHFFLLTNSPLPPPRALYPHPRVCVRPRPSLSDVRPVSECVCCVRMRVCGRSGPSCRAAPALLRGAHDGRAASAAGRGP